MKVKNTMNLDLPIKILFVQIVIMLSERELKIFLKETKIHYFVLNVIV